MPYTSPLETAAVVAAAKIRSQIDRTTHDRYPWLFISPGSKDDVRPVVECLLEDKMKLQSISNETGISFSEDPWRVVTDYYPVAWTKRAGKLERPFPGKFLVILGLEYVDQNNGFPKFDQGSLSPGDYIVVSGNTDLQLTEGGGGTSLFILLSPNERLV